MGSRFQSEVRQALDGLKIRRENAAWVAKRVATALWSSGELTIRERKHFQRTYDLAERVIPDDVRGRPLTKRDGIEALLLKALDGHGWATTERSPRPGG